MAGRAACPPRRRSRRPPRSCTARPRGRAGTGARRRTRHPRRGCSCRRTTRRMLVSSLRARAARATAPIRSQSGGDSRLSRRGHELVEPARQDLARDASRPAAQHLPSARDEDDDRRLARGVVEPDAFGGDRDRAGRGRACPRTRRAGSASSSATTPSSATASSCSSTAAATSRCTSAQRPHQLAVNTSRAGAPPRGRPRRSACRRAAGRRTAGARKRTGGRLRVLDPGRHGAGQIGCSARRLVVAAAARDDEEADEQRCLAMAPR